MRNDYSYRQGNIINVIMKLGVLGNSISVTIVIIQCNTVLLRYMFDKDKTI